MRISASLMLVAAVLLLTACGQRGPLYLPDEEPRGTRQPAPAATPAPSTTMPQSTASPAPAEPEATEPAATSEKEKEDDDEQKAPEPRSSGYSADAAGVAGHPPRAGTRGDGRG